MSKNPTLSDRLMTTPARRPMALGREGATRASETEASTRPNPTTASALVNGMPAPGSQPSDRQFSSLPSLQYLTIALAPSQGELQ